MKRVSSCLAGIPTSVAVAAVVVGWGSAGCFGTSLDSSGDGGSPADAGSPADHAPACHAVLNGGLDTGFDECDNGVTRRRAAVVCPTGDTDAANQCPGSCSSDADCTAEPLGYCADARHLAGYCGCFYGCSKDSDCGPGSICRCGVVVGHCVPATCTTGADCEAGLDCISTVHAPSATVCPDRAHPTFACETAADTCHGSRDCGDSSTTPASCVLVSDHRVCGLGCI